MPFWQWLSPPQPPLFGQVMLSQTPSTAPSVRDPSQDLHEPVHALLQQYPCAQNPVAHSAAVVQGEPWGSGIVQVVPEQT
jgi:hypothetical protein